jgi:hypothetical protein
MFSNFKGQSMSQFEFIFSLYSLLLGFSLVELLSGLGRTLKLRLHLEASAHSGVRIGWLTPLLGLFVMLDLLSFWSSAWVVRHQLSVSGLTLMATMLFASAYYLAAHLVFPDDPAKHRDLDEHYFKVRRVVFAVLFVLLLVQLVFYALTPELAERLSTPRFAVWTAILVALMGAALRVKSKRFNLLVLIALNLRYVSTFVLY